MEVPEKQENTTTDKTEDGKDSANKTDAASNQFDRFCELTSSTVAARLTPAIALWTTVASRHSSALY